MSFYKLNSPIPKHMKYRVMVVEYEDADGWSITYEPQAKKSFFHKWRPILADNVLGSPHTRHPFKDQISAVNAIESYNESIRGPFVKIMYRDVKGMLDHIEYNRNTIKDIPPPPKKEKNK